MERYTIVQLKEQLEWRGLSSTGSKADLFIRLQEAQQHEEITEQQTKR